MTQRKRSRTSVSPLEKPYQSFSIIYPTNKIGRQQLHELLMGNGALNHVPYAMLDYLLRPLPGKSRPVCKSVVVEHRYRDKDHTSAVSSYYSKSFQRVETECERLHFFSRRLSADSIDMASANDLEKSYLGFCVLRPFQQRNIGRTVLKRLRHKPILEFPTCRGKFEVNLAGSALSVEGPGFMEQETMVSSCASASIWMSTATMSQRFGLQQRSTSEITQLASQYLIKQRPMPSEGLLVEQMVHCLRAMGYDPILVDTMNTRQAKHTIYEYIESEIMPIILCSFATGGDHALVGVGHGYELPQLNPKKTAIEWPGEPPLEFSRSSEWVPYILVNDDQRGPYRKFTFIENDSDTNVLADRIRRAHPEVNICDLQLEEWNCPVTIDLEMPAVGYSAGEDIANVWGIIVPLPTGVILTAEQAEGKSARVITLWHWLNSIPMPKRMVLRTYLVPSNEYKERIKESEMDPFVKGLLRGKPLPRWIWITEISSIASYNSPDPEKWLINGQVLIDATGNAFTPDFLFFHYIVNNHAILATMVPEHQNAEQALSRYWESNMDLPYRGYVRL